MSIVHWRKINYYASKRCSTGYCDDIIQFFSFQKVNHHQIIIERIDYIRRNIHVFISEIDEKELEEGLKASLGIKIHDTISIIIDLKLLNYLLRFDLSTPSNYLTAALLGAVFSSSLIDGTILVVLENFQKACAILGCWSNVIPTEFMENSPKYPLRCNFLNRRQSTIKQSFRLSALTQCQHYKIGN